MGLVWCILFPRHKDSRKDWLCRRQGRDLLNLGSSMLVDSHGKDRQDDCVSFRDRQTLRVSLLVWIAAEVADLKGSTILLPCPYPSLEIPDPWQWS